MESSGLKSHSITSTKGRASPVAPRPIPFLASDRRASNVLDCLEVTTGLSD